MLGGLSRRLSGGFLDSDDRLIGEGLGVWSLLMFVVVCILRTGNHALELEFANRVGHFQDFILLFLFVVWRRCVEATGNVCALFEV